MVFSVMGVVSAASTNITTMTISNSIKLKPRARFS
jgi:hypothetical protein